MKDYYYEYICIAFINMIKCTKRAGELRKKKLGNILMKIFDRIF